MMQTFDARVAARFTLLRHAGHLADALQVLLHYGRYNEAKTFALDHSSEESAARTELFEVVLKFWLNSELDSRASSRSSRTPNSTVSSTPSSSSSSTATPRPSKCSSTSTSSSTSRNTLDLWDHASRRTSLPRDRAIKHPELHGEEKVGASDSVRSRSKHTDHWPPSSCSCGMRSLGLIEHCACEESLGAFNKCLLFRYIKERISFQTITVFSATKNQKWLRLFDSVQSSTTVLVITPRKSKLGTACL